MVAGEETGFPVKMTQGGQYENSVAEGRKEACRFDAHSSSLPGLP